MLFLRPSSFVKHVNPVGALGDLVSVIRGAGKMRWPMALLAALATYLILSMLTHEEERILPRPPTITYITSWHAGRTDAQIIASNIANQRIKDRLAAEQAKRDAMVKGIYKEIGRASGMDVDKLDAEGQAEAAADARAAAAKQAALYHGGAAQSSAQNPATNPATR